MKKRLLVASWMAVLISPAMVWAAQPELDPLVGTWVLCQDQDHSPKDRLRFFAEGYGFDLRPSRPKVPFLYKEAAGQLLLVANSGGKLVNIYLSVDAPHTRLTLKNERNGHEAFYVRAGQEQAFACTAK